MWGSASCQCRVCHTKRSALAAVSSSGRWVARTFAEMMQTEFTRDVAAYERMFYLAEFMLE